MPPQRPAGPRPVPVVGFTGGLVLLAVAYWHPSIHILWQAPLGVLLAVSSLGKMVSR